MCTSENDATPLMAVVENLVAFEQTVPEMVFSSVLPMHSHVPEVMFS